MNSLCFQISDWILIVEENKLYRQGRQVTVEPRLVNLLSFLSQSAEEVCCRDELIERVWDGAIVTDQVVTQSIFELRKILKDGRVDCVRFIATVPKRGYKLVADVVQLTPEEAHKKIASLQSPQDASKSQSPQESNPAVSQTQTLQQQQDSMVTESQQEETRAVSTSPFIFYQRCKLYFLD